MKKRLKAIGLILATFFAVIFLIEAFGLIFSFMILEGLCCLALSIVCALPIINWIVLKLPAKKAPIKPSGDFIRQTENEPISSPDEIIDDVKKSILKAVDEAHIDVSITTNAPTPNTTTPQVSYNKPKVVSEQNGITILDNGAISIEQKGQDFDGKILYQQNNQYLAAGSWYKDSTGDSKDGILLCNSNEIIYKKTVEDYSCIEMARILPDGRVCYYFDETTIVMLDQSGKQITKHTVGISYDEDCCGVSDDCIFLMGQPETQTDDYLYVLCFQDLKFWKKKLPEIEYPTGTSTDDEEDIESAYPESASYAEGIITVQYDNPDIQVKYNLQGEKIKE